jgi:DNA modification methylase
MKPVELVERAIRNNSKSRDIVLDSFGGSGTTLIACEKIGRQARLIELDPKYCDVIVKRWEEFTGKTAVRNEDGSIAPQSSKTVINHDSRTPATSNASKDGKRHRPATSSKRKRA